MAVLTRKLGERVTNSPGEDENWWLLAYDTETRDLYVLGESSRADASGARSDATSVRTSLQDYLQCKLPGSDALELAIRGMFNH